MRERAVELNKKRGVLYSFILIVFIAVGIICGKEHEAWEDEAQAWLIARDNGWLSIPSAVRYEGTPALWHLILKVFIVFGLKYEYLFVIPMLFSTVGIVILLFYIDIPDVYKVLISFSYFIFYWNLVVARSYCLVFPLMMLLVLFYKDKKKKPLRFFIV